MNSINFGSQSQPSKHDKNQTNEVNWSKVGTYVSNGKRKNPMTLKVKGQGHNGQIYWYDPEIMIELSLVYLIKLDTHFVHDKMLNPIECQGQRWKAKDWQMCNFYWNGEGRKLPTPFLFRRS